MARLVRETHNNSNAPKDIARLARDSSFRLCLRGIRNWQQLRPLLSPFFSDAPFVRSFLSPPFFWTHLFSRTGNPVPRTALRCIEPQRDAEPQSRRWKVQHAGWGSEVRLWTTTKLWHVISPLNNKPPLMKNNNFGGICLFTINLDGGTITPS